MPTLKVVLAASLVLGLLQFPGPATGEQRPSSHALYAIPFASGTVDPVRDLEATDPAGTISCSCSSKATATRGS